MARLPIATDAELLRVVEETGVVVLGLTRGASWAHVVAFLRSMLSLDDFRGGNGELQAGGQDDLFTLANAARPFPYVVYDAFC